jgi:type VI secretion system protein ImpB
MASGSRQKTLERVRRPRVQISYDVETVGGMRKVELPFVVGVMADLSGMPAKPLPAMKERKFVPIDRDNFNKVLAKMEPRLALRVQNKLTDENTKLGAELNFRHIDDFEPARVAEQIPALKELLDVRQRLSQLLNKMEGNEKLERLLDDIINNPDKKAALAKLVPEGGSEAPKAEAEAPKTEEK